MRFQETGSFHIGTRSSFGAVGAVGAPAHGTSLRRQVLRLGCRTNQDTQCGTIQIGIGITDGGDHNSRRETQELFVGPLLRGLDVSIQEKWEHHRAVGHESAFGQCKGALEKIKPPLRHDSGDGGPSTISLLYTSDAADDTP